MTDERPTSLTPSSASALAPLRQRIAEIEHQLEPITRDAAIDAVAVMLKAFGAVAGGDDPALARLYLKATDGLPKGAVESLCEDIALGRLDGVSDDYPPKVPKFARLLRTRAESLQATLRNRRRELGEVKMPLLAPTVPLRQPGPPKSVEETRGDALNARAAVAQTARERDERIATDLAERRRQREASADVEPPSDVEPIGETPMTG